MLPRKNAGKHCHDCYRAYFLLAVFFVVLVFFFDEKCIVLIAEVLARFVDIPANSDSGR